MVTIHLRTDGCSSSSPASRFRVIMWTLAMRVGDRFSVMTPKGRVEFTLVDPFHYEPADAMPDARLTSLMPGRVVKVLAKAGEKVAKGQALMILEAMKMEHTVTSPREGVIDRVAFRENELVPADAVLVAFREG